MRGKCKLFRIDVPSYSPHQVIISPGPGPIITQAANWGQPAGVWGCQLWRLAAKTPLFTEIAAAPWMCLCVNMCVCVCVCVCVFVKERECMCVVCSLAHTRVPSPQRFFYCDWTLPEKEAKVWTPEESWSIPRCIFTFITLKLLDARLTAGWPFSCFPIFGTHAHYNASAWQKFWWLFRRDFFPSVQMIKLCLNLISSYVKQFLPLPNSGHIELFWPENHLEGQSLQTNHLALSVNLKSRGEMLRLIVPACSSLLAECMHMPRTDVCIAK